MLKKVEIYTDGACSNNPGAGGWAAILFYKDTKKEISGGEIETTNNRMELMAVIMGLETLKERCDVTIYSDSAYTVNAFSQNWLNIWISNGFKTAQKKDVANKDLWERLKCLTKKHNVNFVKVKGHSDNEFNNRCDELARAEIKTLKSI
jgi:ribonuclease HI